MTASLFGEIIFNALEKDREERYQEMNDLLVDLCRLKKRIYFGAELERSHGAEATLHNEGQDAAEQLSRQIVH